MTGLQQPPEIWSKYKLSAPSDWFRFTELNDDTVLLDYRDHFSFHIDTQTENIQVYKSSSASNLQLQVYMETQLRGLRLTMAGREPLHGSVLSFGGRGFALLADSGSGKSTLAAALMREGARLVSDDLLVYKRTAEGICVEPSDPLYLKLFPEAWRLLAPNLEPVTTLNNVTSKLIFELNPCVSAPPLRAIYVLEEGLEFSLKELSPLEAYLAAAKNTFTTVWWPERRARAQLTNLHKLTQTVPFFSLSYPRRWESIKDVCRQIIDQANEI